jgi:hypothetical protein
MQEDLTMAEKKTTKQIQEELVTSMGQWQKIEDTSVESCARVIESTDNPLIKLVMEIIQADSKMHYRVQGLIADSIQNPISLTPDDMSEVWEGIEKHLKLEKQMVGHVEKALADVKKRKMMVPEYLLNYLYTDEIKHNSLLSLLEVIKKGMYPYG